MRGISMFPMIRKDRINKNGLAPILIRVDLNSKPVAYDKLGSKSHKIPAQFWDETKRAVSSAYGNAKEINLKISSRMIELEKEFLRLEIQGIPITKQAIKDIVDGTQASRSFYRYCEARIEILKKEFAPLTIKRFKSEISKLSEFRVELGFADISPAFLDKYDTYMRTVLKNTPNTVGKSMKFISRMLKDAINDKLIKDNPFSIYKIPTYRKPERIWLEPAELASIEALLHRPEVDESIKATAAFFLCECMCGARHSDWKKLKYIDSEKDYFLYTTQKTKTDIAFPIGPSLRRILKIIREQDYSPLSLQKSNGHLKVIALMAKVNKKFSTHLGRHTFGFQCAKLKIPKSVTAELMGVTEKTVEIYYHLAGEDISEQASALRML